MKKEIIIDSGVFQSKKGKVINYELENNLIECHIFYNNGKIAKQCIFDKNTNKLEGICKTFHENGKLHMQTYYKNGKLEGDCLVLYPNGSIYIETYYQNGEIEGEVHAYNSYGIMTDCQICSGGKLIETKFRKNWQLVQKKCK